MKKIFAISILFLLVRLVNAQFQHQKNDMDMGQYLNPIFAGDYPDPSILRDGDDFYLVHSSFDYYPGLLIWHSKDLVYWSPVTNALHKYIGSVWAPDLAKYEGKYYIYFPADQSNYVVWADRIEGPWSEPIDLKISGIDPGHITDDQGNRYLYISDGGYYALAKDGLSVTAEFKKCYDGWPIPADWVIECFCMEGPKLTKHGDYYYLTVAEGGTAGPPTSHMIISARSKSPLGPWENSPYNPIIKTRDASERWWSKGHGTPFEDTNGDWWMIFHAYENGHYNMGRQTLLQAIEWTEDGWFKTPEGINTDQPIKKPAMELSPSTYSLNDDFSGEQLRPHWKFFGEYDTSRFHLEDKSLLIRSKGQAVGECSPLLCIPSDHSYTVDIEMYIEGDATGGLVLFYNNNTHSGILADKANVMCDLRGWQFITERDVLERHVFLRMVNRNDLVNMYYSTDGKKWKKIETSLEVSSWHHNALSGFLSLRIGLCSMGDGEVRFKNFHYKALE